MTNGPFLTKLKKWKKNTLSSLWKWQNWAFWQNWRSEKIHEPLSKWQNGAFLTKIVCYITIHSVYSYYTYAYLIIWSPLFKNDKMGHFWQYWNVKKLPGPLRKWQNWAFLTKLKKWTNSRSSPKITKLSILTKLKKRKKSTVLSQNDKIEEAKKSTGLSQNDKIGHFWQNWRSEKIHEPLTKWQNGAFLTKIVCYITTHSVYS